MEISNQICVFFVILTFFTIYKFYKNEKKNRASQSSSPEPVDMSPNEKKIREQWLISLWILTGLNFLNYACEGLEKNLGPLPSLFFGVVAGILTFWIPYHCAYKKRGTGWLLWTMIVGPFSLLRGVIEVTTDKEINSYEGLQLFLAMVFYAIYAFTVAIYLVNCFRLRAINVETS